MPADTRVKFFHSELSGAPVLSGSAGALIALLDACLVTGWGTAAVDQIAVTDGVAVATCSLGHAASAHQVIEIAGSGQAPLNAQHRATATSASTVTFDVTGVANGTYTGGGVTLKIAAAGWSVVYSAANKRVYRSLDVTSTQFYLRIDDSAADNARVRGFESMSDVDTGVGPCPNEAQVSGGLFWPKGSSGAARRWIVAADAAGIVYAPAYSPTYPLSHHAHYAGDFVTAMAVDAYRFCVNGDTVSPLGGSSVGAIYSALTNLVDTSGTFVMRPYAGVGGAINCTLGWVGAMRSSTSGNVHSGYTGYPPGPSPMTGRIDLAPLVLLEGSGVSADLRGGVPGVLRSENYLGSAFETGDFLTAEIDLAGRKLLAFRVGGSTSISSCGRAFIDITGPWR